MKPRLLAAREPDALLDFLLRECADAGRKKIKQWLKFGAVTVNGGAVTRHDHPLKPGDKIRIEPFKKTDSPPPFRIVHEDDAILVADKPGGLLTVATDRAGGETAYFLLNEYLKRRRPQLKERVFIVHRLDRDTSGLIVFAKNEKAKRALQEAWDNVEKRYLAVVEGTPEAPAGTLRSHLAEDKFRRVFSGPQSKASKYAITEYRVLKPGARYSLLEITLKTGRKNQIRVHMKDLGHPVAGDQKYGARTDPAGRLGLHAHALAFPHPVSGTRMEFTSPLPENLHRLIPAAVP